MATLLQAFQTRTWCSNNLYQTPLTESAAYASDADTRTGWAGLNQTGTDGLPNGRYVLELRCEKSTRPGKDIKLTLEVGPRGFVNSDAQYPLAYKIFGGSEVTQDVLTAIYGENPVPHSGDESAKQGGARDGAAKEDGRD